MNEIKNIKACVCPECGDTYDVGKLFKTMTNLEQIEFCIEPKECLKCHKMYLPFGHIYNMDEFVFDAVRTVKM